MKRVLITGAGGYIGGLLTEALADDFDNVELLVACDLRAGQGADRSVKVAMDIRDPKLVELLKEHHIDTVVHLAAVVKPPATMTAETLYDIEVGGTQNVIDACVQAGVTRLVYTSSGAAYGYSPENASLLREDDPLRSDTVFPYAWHKRRNEEILAEARAQHPALEQVIFRVSTILGPTVNNPITALFERPVVVGIRGVASPFCMVWDQDVVNCLIQGVLGDKTGVFNLSGDGVMTLREIAVAMERRYIGVPARALRGALRGLRKVGLGTHRPEQLGFLKHRPVLDNARLKSDFDFMPRKTTREVFELYRCSRA